MSARFEAVADQRKAKAKAQAAPSSQEPCARHELTYHSDITQSGSWTRELGGSLVGCNALLLASVLRAGKIFKTSTLPPPQNPCLKMFQAFEQKKQPAYHQVGALRLKRITHEHPADYFTYCTSRQSSHDLRSGHPEGRHIGSTSVALGPR